MVISHKHRYLFVEVPHTASTAISRELRKLYDGEYVLSKHAKYSDAARMKDVRLSDYFVFGTVRNPIDSFVTLYYKLSSDHSGMYSNPKRHEDQGGSVPKEHVERFAFIQEHPDDFPAYALRYMSGSYVNYYLVGAEKFDALMRFETVGEDFEGVLRRIGLDVQRPLPLLNKTQRPRDYLHLFDDRAAARASDFFGPFLEDWGYSIPDGWPRPSSRAKIAYHTRKKLGNTALMHFGLDAHNRTLRRLRRVIDGPQ